MEPTPDEIARMKNEATERVRRMQQRANQAVNQGMPPAPNFVKVVTPPEQNHAPTVAMSPAPQRKQGLFGNLLGGIKGFDLLKRFNLKNIGIDSDVLIIIALILILSSDDCDELLLLTLVYIML